ncbi:MAG TPA: TetR/AcrR family transcriptional regulator [Spirochaetota bacterium]|nr:TetR/AcrR family transcriptional regulator [Spirochaetota bacterium]HPJ35834.1 TetR/AcrR family transcriptional regulator [Spirochaetota bacterium]
MNDKRESSAGRRLEIIRMARELFRTRDYETTTMQELTGRLNIAKGTVYHYFTSKKELLEAVVEDIVADELKRKKELLKLAGEKNLSALVKLKLLITEDETVHIRERILNSLNKPENSRLHTELLGKYINELAPLYASVFLQGCEEGIFKMDYPLECAEFIIAGVQFLTESGFYPWNELQLNRRIKAIPFLIEAQLSALAGSLLFFNENKN